MARLERASDDRSEIAHDRPSTRPAHLRSTALAEQHKLERDELQSDALRLRWLTTYAAALWPAFGLLDWIVVTFITPGNLAYYLGIRALTSIPIVTAILLLWRWPNPSRITLSLLDLMIFCPATVGVAFMCLEYHGIASPYFAGVIVITVVRASILADPWERGTLLVGLPALLFPTVLLGAALFDTAVAAQFGRARDLGMFAQSLFFIFSAVGACVYGGHTAWVLRRQVFQSRAIGRYRLKERIGRGGMGEVWIATHAGLRRDVALKMLRPGTEHSEYFVQRFELEVAATTRLTHPNTVRVFDYGVTDDGIWYYAMELLEGCNLAELIDRECRLPLTRALHIGQQLARALAEAHEQGIVHRDVKPENVFITRAGNEPDFVKVLDFGIAKLTDATGTPTLTATGSIFGTPAFMSPEAAAGRPSDARSDIYSFGAVLFFMLTGRPPFESESPGELMMLHISAEAPAVAEHGATVPDPVDALVRRCLAKSPDDRFANASELASALDTCRADATAIDQRDTLPPVAG